MSCVALSHSQSSQPSYRKMGGCLLTKVGDFVKGEEIESYATRQVMSSWGVEGGELWSRSRNSRELVMTISLF
jgi:hypothetical protein